MRKSKFSESQIVGILKDAESSVPVADLLRKYGVSKATFFQWRSTYGGASISDVKRLRELETENAKLEANVCGLGARERRHQGCAPPKTVTPSAKRQMVEVLVAEHQPPVQRACRVMRLSRAAYGVLPASSPSESAGCRRHRSADVEGCRWNHNHVYRVCARGG